MAREKQYWEEWNKLVEESKENLRGTCPLIKDAVILFIDEHIKTLHNVINGDYS